MINPQNIIPALHLIRLGLENGFLTESEVIDWADVIIIKDEQPDIFFIELSLLASKNLGDFSRYFNEYLHSEVPTYESKLRLGLIYKEYSSGNWNIEGTITKLCHLTNESLCTPNEIENIYRLDNYYDAIGYNVYCKLEVLKNDLENFLNVYKDISFENYRASKDWDLEIEYYHKLNTQTK